MILDGFGLNDRTDGNAVAQAKTPVMDQLMKEYPFVKGNASGLAVGLPDGQMGNSEVGHMNMGAGRIVYQELTRITKEINDGDFFKNQALLDGMENVKKNNSDLHLYGLLSDGGVHSHITHVYGLLELAKREGIKNVYVHCFLDGRDTAPTSGKGFIEALEKHLSEKKGAIASIIGRYYAMDRDKRWERVKEAYDLLVNGKGTPATDMVAAMQASYDADITDEFVKPIVHVGVDGKPVSVIEEGDVVIFFNYRNDRAKELTVVLTQQDMPEAGMHTLPLYYCCMTPYDAKFTGVHILFDKENVVNTLGEIVSKAGRKQLRIAETEKYAHVTFFFSGGREKEFDGEDRILIPSPKVATYDLIPEMSVYEVKDALNNALASGKYDLVVCNFANGDMVGHTGVYEAIEKAVKAVDECVGSVIDTAVANGYEAIIIADHGNADHALNADGTPNTAHSLNPVPFVYVTSNKAAQVENGILADVAPSLCHIMGIELPAEMTGKCLIKD